LILRTALRSRAKSIAFTTNAACARNYAIAPVSERGVGAVARLA
jgi:hypothetical protein